MHPSTVVPARTGGTGTFSLPHEKRLHKETDQGTDLPYVIPCKDVVEKCPYPPYATAPAPSKPRARDPRPAPPKPKPPNVKRTRTGYP